MMHRKTTGLRLIVGTFAAAAALGAYPGASAAAADDAALSKILTEMKAPEKAVRLAAIGKLVHYAGGEEAKVPALAALQDAMRDREPEVRAVACTATGNMRELAVPAVPALVRLLRDREAEVRQCAVRALGRVGPKVEKAKKDMRRLTRDDDPVVRVVAHGALIRVGESPDEHLPAIIAGMMSETAVVRLKSAHACEPLETLAAPAVPHIAALLRDPDDHVRHYAARALVNLGETARPALAALKEALVRETVADNRGLIQAALRRLEPAGGAAVTPRTPGSFSSCLPPGRQPFGVLVQGSGGKLASTAV